MCKSSKLLFLLLSFLLLQLLADVECRRSSSSSSRRGSSRGKSSSQTQQTSSGQGGWFSSWFGGSGTKAATSGSVKPASSGTSGTNTGSYGFASNSKPASSGTSGTNTGSYGFASNSKPADQKPYGWTVPNQNKPAVQPASGWNPGQTKPAGQNTAWGGSSGQTKPAGQNTAWGGSSGQTKPGQQHPYGWSPPSQNIGAGGYPVQQGVNYRGTSNNNMGTKYNTGYSNHPPPSYNSGGHYSSQGFHQSGGYPHQGYSPQGYSSHYGLSQNYYPGHTSFGYPGQGLFGGSSGPKYGGMGLFGGGSGHYGYPGGSSWGYPSYGGGGFKSSSGKGNLLTGLALGAGAGYLTSSLVNRISNPWGYSGYGYGNNYGYRRSYYNDPTPPPPTSPPNPADNWIHCVAFDPATNQTLINPNCSCTVTTMTDPVTNLPISTHNCTTLNGQLIPPQPPQSYGLPPQPSVGVNNPNASSVYPSLYQENQRYGVGLLESGYLGASNITVQNNTSTTTAEPLDGNSPAPLKQTEGEIETHRKLAEFYTKLEKMVDMGKFSRK